MKLPYAVLLPLAALLPVNAHAATAAAPALALSPGPVATETPLPAASSNIVITLGASGNFERKTVNYGCQGDVETLAVDYINAAPNYLALIPLDGSKLVFNTVLAASGAKYAAGKYVWWNKGTDAELYDLTQGDKAKPILTCSEVNDTP